MSWSRAYHQSPGNHRRLRGVRVSSARLAGRPVKKAKSKRRPRTPARLRVVFVDDHPVVLEGFRRILEHDFDVVSCARDGESALAEAKKHSPDVLVCDISMPGMSGFDVARRLKVELPRVRVVFATMHDDRAYVAAAMKAGVYGYFVKTAEPAELASAIRAAAAGELYICTSLRDTLPRKRG
jgi:DNA-binding NarL/FixJ family response regulator